MNNESYSIKQGYVLREIADEYLAVPINSGAESSQLIILNPVSALLWKQLQNKTTLEQLVDAVKSEFDVSREEAESDIKAFLENLKELNLLN